MISGASARLAQSHWTALWANLPEEKPTLAAQVGRRESVHYYINNVNQFTVISCTNLTAGDLIVRLKVRLILRQRPSPTQVRVDRQAIIQLWRVAHAWCRMFTDAAHCTMWTDSCRCVCDDDDDDRRRKTKAHKLLPHRIMSLHESSSVGKHYQWH